MTEHEMQKSIIAECALRAKQDPRYDLILAIPNGGHRDVRVAVKLKAEGVRAGVPDLALFIPSRGYHGLFMELKVGRNKATVEQKIWMGTLFQAGYFVAEVHDDPAEAIRLIEWYIEGA